METQPSTAQDHKRLIRDIIALIGDDPDREGLIDTPKRVLKSYSEIFGGYSQKPEEILSTCFEDGACDEMVILRQIPFYSTCEHHMLPFKGVGHIGYIPLGRVVGLSKLARLLECFARRLQIQEKLTQQISQAIQNHLQPLGVAVILEAHHMCMSCRGVRKEGSLMVTSSMTGAFRDEPQTRSEFLTLIKS